MNLVPGSFVRVTTKNLGILEGVVIQRPSLLVNGFFVLKLSSGYNIGVSLKNVVKCQKLRALSQGVFNGVFDHAQKLQREQFPTLQNVRNGSLRLPSISISPPVVFNPSLPNVSILSTGGTISSRVDYVTGGVSADYSAEDFLVMIPEISRVANISAKKVLSIMSENAVPDDWLLIAKKVFSELRKDYVRGVVVTTGTDTLHYTSAALSFLLRGLSKPVIVTGAQRSIDRGSSDAFLNLSCAVNAVSRGPPGVFVCLHENLDDDFCLLIHGSRVRKMHTSRRDAFRPVNSRPVARVGPLSLTILDNSSWIADGNSKLSLQDSVDSNVALLYAYPGINPKIVSSIVKSGVKTIVIGATALGHVPVNGSSSLVKVLKGAVKSGVLVVVTSQTLYGRVNPLVYDNGRILALTLGCTFLEGITPESAYSKAVVVGGLTKDRGERLDLLKKNFVGEFSCREIPEEFLL
ncbi:Glu-tRNA(Gln) amidotransferase subunit GatD [Candidatus Woesearchaeota archaeon]|nr:Glu-tRNA(Gln) amidotransferase subunit GatD [Candidatus Woesearchaeota archaeon]